MSNPTAAQKLRWDRVANLGCLPCRLDGFFGTPATISHCHDHGNRDHDRVWPGCPVHHLYQEAVDGIPNRHKNPVEFAKKYGTDDELHRITCALLGEAPE